jgi:hypothetical protein
VQFAINSGRQTLRNTAGGRKGQSSGKTWAHPGRELLGVPTELQQVTNDGVSEADVTVIRVNCASTRVFADEDTWMQGQKYVTKPAAPAASQLGSWKEVTALQSSYMSGSHRHCSVRRTSCRSWWTTLGRTLKAALLCGLRDTPADPLEELPLLARCAASDCGDARGAPCSVASQIYKGSFNC